ncbi:helix-turn-helix transcriptional regulator [Salmonella enterica]|uniref:Helix-turn-helix transcriptional regulator n=1 Tax=Salmonella enterica subsp. enterica serovar Miami TaxID=286780 RepID=A0A753ALH8_SALET|nr:helix-turn-helix transcriptional regulator [Salmonella enterica]ECS7317049.1 helix-turn-helix domain-containing protein [Salmonella enterica subsp. enterica serovar Miami str. CFSAN000579]EDV7008358.1 helix-turn-helix transcriptional regulator [Salmonella enterica subsp. enterica serovar Miami]HAA1152755.1 helix-turn-helix domain-containing protein [Salmonella enterica subsp. enterica serovar Pullorum]HBL9891161.1 helix-turn-helix transcriptional regulator [Salmonella enterica subsp. enteric
MFNVKRNGAIVEITEIPASIPFSTFKNIADETGATETLVCYFKDKTEYEVIIQQTNENMAGMVAWLALEKRDDVITGDAGADVGDADISTIGKRIGVARVKQHMSAQELEDAIGAPEGSVFRWETGKIVPSAMDIAMLADVLKCNKEWLEISSKYKNELPPDCESRNMEETVMIAMREASRTMEKHEINSLFKSYYVLVI